MKNIIIFLVMIFSLVFASCVLTDDDSSKKKKDTGTDIDLSDDDDIVDPTDDIVDLIDASTDKVPGSTIDTPAFEDGEELWLAPDGTDVGDTAAFTEGSNMTANFDPLTLYINVPLDPGQYYLYKVRASDDEVLSKSTNFVTVLGEVPRNLFNGEMYMAYEDGSNSDKITVEKYSEDTWSTVGAAGFTSDAVNDLYPPNHQVAIDQSTGNIYMCYQATTGGWEGQGSLYKYDGASWTSVWTNAHPTYNPNLYITLDGTKYIFYKDNSNGSWFMRLSKITSDGTHTKINTTFDTAYGNAMFVSDDVLYIAYCDNTDPNRYRLSVIKYDTATAFSAGNVVAVGSTKFSAAEAYSPAIYVADGTPYVAFADNANSKKLTVMKYTGTAWEVVGSAGFTSHAITTYQSLYNLEDYNAGDDTKHTYGTTAICVGGGNIYVTAEDKTTMQASIYKYNGTAWSTLQANYATKTLEPTLTYDNGKLIVIYKALDKSGPVMYTCND